MQERSSNNKIWFLISRSLSGEATPEEEQLLQHLLQENTALQQQYELIKRMWGAGEKQPDGFVDEDEKQNISRILKLARLESEKEDEAIPLKRNRNYFFLIPAAAALLIIVFGIRMFYGKSDLPANAGLQTIAAEKGSRMRTILPDGTTVWLNAGSHISFSENFTGHTREVTLDGEAYFDVVKQPERPFIVHVYGYNIRVLGTVFNVKSYPTDKTIETTLLRGLVQVTKQGVTGEKPIFIHPNEKLIVEKFAANSELNLPYKNSPAANSGNTDYIIKNLDTAQTEKEKIETAWVYNRLEFRGDNFEELAKKLERWYNVSIVFNDDQVKQLSFYGSFETETVQQAFVALKAAARFDYSINNQTISVSSINKNK